MKGSRGVVVRIQDIVGDSEIAHKEIEGVLYLLWTVAHLGKDTQELVGTDNCHYLPTMTHFS